MIPTNLDADTEDDRARFVLYLNKRKHAQLCDFLYSLPQGTVSNFIRETLQQHILMGGLAPVLTPLNPESAGPQRNDPAHRRLPAATVVPTMSLERAPRK